MAGFLTNLLGGSVAEPINAITTLVDEVWTSEDEKLERKEIIARIKQRPMLAQLAINKVEAQHRSVFVAGWRPGVGWVCVLALLYMWVIRPILADIMSSFGVPLQPLDIDIADLLSLMLPLLGLGGLRSLEKMAGRAK